MSDTTFAIRTNYSGSEHTRDDVKQQILEKFGPKLASQYNPYENCMSLVSWAKNGYRVKPGEKSLKSIVIIEKKDENDEVVSSYPKTVHLFYFPQVKRIPNYGK